MSQNDDTQKPAFPQVQAVETITQVTQGVPGVSDRALAAMFAMAGLLANPHTCDYAKDANGVAELAVEQADALLAELAKGAE